MTRNREIPDRWPTSKPSQPGRLNGRQRKRSDSTAKRPASSLPSQQLYPMAEQHLEPQQAVQGVPSPLPPQLRQPSRRRFKFNLQVGVALIVLGFGSVGFIAVALLLKLPAVPNCPATFWPTASASMRLYCAEIAANKQTAENLLEAIALVEALPKDHPLRPEIDRNIEEWSRDILKIGEEKFQAGQLNEAIKIARRIPTHVAAYKLVETEIGRWQSIWAKAEALYQKAENQLKESNWNLAFREAVKLTYVDNKFWATVKYDKLVDLIQIGREASAKLDKAYRLSKTGRVDDILAAIKEAEAIPRESFAYKEAQDLIAECGNKLVKIAQDRLERRNWQGVLEIANKLPASVKLPEVKADLIDLANAISSAESGTATDLEAAIASAQKLTPDRPLYEKGQQLISRWQRETEDVTRLERARTFANSGLTSDLRAAIAEAEEIPSGNPRYQEARKEITRWTSQAETIEDRPYIDRAVQIANLGGIASLQEAVQEASRVAPGRTLYREAQDKIRQWTDTIQRTQDQPYLDQARSLASSGNIPAAITAAQQIQSGRALYREAQGDVNRWQTEARGQQRLQEAYQTANPGTPEALSAAIRVARQVPTASSSRDNARLVVNRWSYQLLSMANDRSSYNMTEAIAIARLIPSGTEAYSSAQQQIQAWQNILNPPPSPTLELPSSPNGQFQ